MKLFNGIDNLRRNGLFRGRWKGNAHGEKYTQNVKNEFTSKKRKFGEILLKNIYTKKVLSYLTNEIDNDVDCTQDISSYLIKSTDVLKPKMQKGLPIPFIANDKNEF